MNPFPGAESRPNEPSECVLPRTPLKKWNHLLLHWPVTNATSRDSTAR